MVAYLVVFTTWYRLGRDHLHLSYQPQPPDWKLRSNDPTGSQATETDQLTKKPPELPSSAMERLAADHDKIATVY